MATLTVTVNVDAEGRVVPPVEARRDLQVEGETSLQLETSEDALILRLPAVPEEDRWLSTPELLARVERARSRPLDQDVRLSREDLERLAPVDPE